MKRLKATAFSTTSMLSLAFCNILMKLAGDEFGPINSNIFSLIIASITSILIGKKKLSWKAIKLSIIPAIFYFLLMLSTFFAFKFGEVGTVSLILNTNILFVAVISHFFLKEKISKSEFIGLTILGFGLSLMFINIKIDMFSVLLSLIASLFITAYSISAKIFSKGFEKTSFLISFLTLASFFSLVFIPFMESKKFSFYIIPLGILIAIYQLLFYKAIQIEEVSYVQPFLSSSSAFAVLFGILILGEEITFQKIISIPLISLGLFFPVMAKKYKLLR